MNVRMISPRGYCYGVVDAMVLVRRIAADPEVPRPIHVLGMLVHNRQVTEAFEEIGLSEKHIKRLGYLDITTTGTNYMILPVVGLIDIDFLPKINKNEVEDIIYLPLEFIEHKNNLKFVDKEFNGTRKSFYLYQYKEYSIWGATARILKTLSERFFQ